jgi:hypothetical protein
MPFTVAEKNAMLDDFAGRGLYLALHSGDPASGGNEITGGSPAYARQEIDWNAADAGEVDAPAIEFDVPAGASVAWVGIWSASTSGTLRFKKQVTAETYAAQGVHTVTITSIGIGDPA